MATEARRLVNHPSVVDFPDRQRRSAPRPAVERELVAELRKMGTWQARGCRQPASLRTTPLLGKKAA